MWSHRFCLGVLLNLFSFFLFAQEPERNDGRLLFEEAWPDREAYLSLLKNHAVTNGLAEQEKSSNGWQQLAYRSLRANSPTGSIWSGRVVDLEFFPGDTLPYVLSASGGLYCADQNGRWKNISQQVTSPAGGAFAVSPSDRNFMVLGTGEYTQSDGTGLWITRDGGANWYQPDSFPHAAATSFFRIFFDPADDSLIHIVSIAGYYQSPDAGHTFIRKRAGKVCWIEQSAQQPNLLYAAIMQSGLYKSNDLGNTWQQVQGFYDANLGKTRIALCPSDDQVIYIHGCRNNDQKTKGFFFSKNGGASWDTARVFMDGRYQTDWHYGQGNYNNALAISPDCKEVLAAGVPMIRAFPADSVEFTYFEPNHVDVHDIVFRNTGTGYEIWNANDGGIARYRPGTDTRFIGTGINEFLPITQMYEHDGDKRQLNKVAIATQDNMVAVKLQQNARQDWMTIWGGDGFSVAFDQSNTDRFIARANSFVFRTTDYGQSYSGIGAAPDPDFRTDRVRFDYQTPSTAYATCENNLARQVVTSSDLGSTWTQLNPTDFSANVQNLSIGYGTFPNLYAVSWSGTGERLWVRDRMDGVWHERSSGIVAGQRIEYVMPDVYDPDIALAYLNGNAAALASQKLYYTEDAGKNWYNVSGDLPAVPVRSAIIHPYNRNIMVVGTYGAGFFITRDGGIHWEPWNKGISPYTYVYSRRSFSWVDSTSENGKFYLVAGTYGNGVLTREITDNDTIGTGIGLVYKNNLNICNKIKFKSDYSGIVPDLSELDLRVRMQVTDLSGKLFLEHTQNNENPEIAAQKMQMLMPGIYAIIVSDANGSCALRWIKTKTD